MPITPKGAEGTVEYGLSNVYIASVTETKDPVTGVITTTYGTPKAWPGAVTLNITPKSGSSDVYADNRVWYTTQAASGADGTFESMHVPEWAEVDLLGRTVDSNGGIVETDADRAPYFAMLFEIETDTVPTRYVYYKCQLSQPAGAWETTNENGGDPKKATANIKIIPRADVDEKDGKNVHVLKTKYTATADATAYDGFYTAVVEPNF